MSILRLLLSCVVCAVCGFASAQVLPAAPPKSITVVLDDNYPPFSFRDANGQLQGILKDTWALWQARTGVAVQLQAMDWADAQRTMQAGQADVIDTIFETPERQKLYDFTAPYTRVEVALFFQNSLGGIVDAKSARGFTVGVKEGDACMGTLRSQGVDSFKRYASYSDVVNVAKAGEVRVFCMDLPPATYLLNQMGVADDFRHSPPISVGEFHRAVRKGDAALLHTLEVGFAQIGAVELQKIDDKWLGSAVADSSLPRYVRYAEYATLATAFLVLVLALWNLMLRQRVQEKTRSLTDSLVALDHTRLDLEQALVEQQAMLKNDMVAIAKVQDRLVLWANPAFEVMFGYGTGEAVGTPTRMYYPSEEAYLKMTLQAYPKLMAGQVYRSQIEFVRRDGQSVWVELSGSALASPPGASFWTFLDVTERRRADVARDEALSRLQKLANSAPGMVYQFLLRPDGGSCLPFTSEAIRNIYRVNPQDVQSDASALFAMHHPEDQQQIMASIQESATHLTPWQHEYRVTLDDGTEHWLFGNALPERLDDGLVLWHGFITDITERKAADDRLRQLSRSVEQAPVSIVITDLQGDILYANPTFTRHTGYTLAEAMGQNPRILKSGLTPPEVYVALWDTLSQGGVWQGELHNRRKTGELFIEHAVIAPVLDAHGKTSHYVAVKEDITQRKQAELALQNSLKDKVALLHEVHHRVKNNLQVITSLLRLEAGRSDQPDTRAVLKEMQGRIFAMALLHESLYRAGTFASVELGVYLKQLATQAFRSASGVAGDVRLVLDMSEVQVGMDQATPCGLLVNELISNCLKHAFPSGHGGEVVVSSQPSARTGWWHLTVRDTGVGLPADFEARRTQSLGLQLVADLARQLGGQLDVGSGPGAVFSVQFFLQVFPPSD